MSRVVRLPVLQSPVACDLTALRPDERARRQELFDRVLGSAALWEEIRRRDLLELVGLESRCCPFLGFSVDEADAELRLRLFGPPGTKAFLGAILGGLSGARG